MSKTSFTINRATWLSGKLYADDNTVESLMRDHKGRMCCLGFYARECRIPAKSLTGKGTPLNLKIEHRHKFHNLLAPSSDGIADSYLSGKLIEANDTMGLTPKKREERITELFRKAGIRVRFRGKYPKPPEL